MGGRWLAETLMADAVLAEELGFDSLWVAENHFSVDRQCSSPFVIAGVLAGATRRIRIGVFSVLTFAHPLRVAEDAATLDLMSGGRLMLCFGTGYRAEEFAAFGIAMQGKGARFRECLDVVQKAWAGPFVHYGKHFRIPTAVEDVPPEASAVAVLPQPLQTAMPVWMAAFGDVSVKRAARLGYPLLPAALESIPELQAKYQLYHATWRAGERTAPPHGDAIDARGIRRTTGPYCTSGGRSRTHADIRPLSTLGIADQRRERLRNLVQGPLYHR